MPKLQDTAQNYRTCTGDPNSLSLPGQLGDFMIDRATGTLYLYDGAAPWQQLAPSVPIGDGDSPVSPVPPMLFGSESPNAGPTAGVDGQVFVRIDGASSAVYQFNGTRWGVIGRARGRNSAIPLQVDMAGQVARIVYVGDDCTIDQIAVIAEDAVTVAPAVFTLEINGNPVTGGTVSLGVGAAGSTGSSATTAANALASGDVITVTTSGGSGSGRGRASLECIY